MDHLTDGGVFPAWTTPFQTSLGKLSYK